jgi:hypothetical protein
MVGAVALLAVVTYLPAFNNFFVSDDFVYLAQVRSAGWSLSHLLRIPPGFYRLTAHLYFLFCSGIFGHHAAGYYAVSLMLHIAVCLLVYGLVARITGRRDAAFAAALFFAAYERHHEAILWISAASELTAAIAILACLLLWLRFLSSSGPRRWAWYACAMAAFAASLLSKESSVVAVALMMALDWQFRTSSAAAGEAGTIPGRREAPRFSVASVSIYFPALAVTAIYLYVVYTANPIVRHGYYALSTQFLRVYAKTLNTLLLFVALAVVVWLMARGWRAFRGVLASHRAAITFFLAWLLITPVPFCLATYTGQAPSRQTYLPSVATAALAGLLAAELLRQVGGGKRRTILAICALVLVGNAAYVWKKDRQFEQRAAPTRLLIDTLREGPSGAGKIYVISSSEYYDVICRTVVSGFTERAANDLVFVRPADAGALRPSFDDYVMQWDDRTQVLRVLRRPSRR